MEFRDQSFFSRDIDLDHNTYTGCTFTRCTMKFEGTGAITFSANKIVDCRWVFGGPAIRTLAFLSALYQMGAKDLVEATFENIRRGTTPPAPPEN